MNSTKLYSTYIKKFCGGLKPPSPDVAMTMFVIVVFIYKQNFDNYYKTLVNLPPLCLYLTSPLHYEW